MRGEMNLMIVASFVALAGMSAHAMATRNGAEYDDNVPTGILVADRTPASGDVVTGKWHADLDKCKKFAEDNGIPLLAIWSNGDNCGHCKKWENNAISDAFIAWMKTSGIVFYFGYYGDPGKGATLGEWCYWCGRGNPTGQTLPLVRLYWPKGGVDFSANGDSVDGNKGRCTITSTTPRADEPYYVPGDNGTYNPGGRYMIDFIKRAFAAYDGSGANTYYGGEFTAMNDPNAGLQVIAGETSRLNIPLWRTNATSVAKAYTNQIYGVYPDGSTFTNFIAWAAGEKAYLHPIDITKNGRVKADDAGKTIKLYLFDSKKKKVAESSVAVIAPDRYPNSPGNPLWIGERTKDTLEFGEWTMDIDAVTNKVREWNAALGLMSSSPSPLLGATPGRRAHSLIYVGGSRWCPDCAMADRFFLEDARFRQWAQTYNIALGVVDIPNDPNDQGGSPSLLTYNTFKASDGYVNGRGHWAADETQRYQSGAPYISRKGIVMSGNGGTNATDIAKRNKALVARNTLGGGWNRPERTNQSRTGVPCFIALRDDGTIAGRWEFFSDYGPTGWSDGYLKRLEELLGQADKSEESNQNWRTTSQTVSKRGTSATASLSHSDLVDTYKIDDAAIGQTVSFRISCDEAVDGSLRVVQATESAEKMLAETNGKFSEGIEVTSEIPSSNCYLVVAAAVKAANKPASPISAVLSAETTNSTRVAYAIISSNVVLPGDNPAEETPDDGSSWVTIAVVQGESYRITNVDDATIDGLFDKGVGEDIYIANETGSVTLGLKEKDGATGKYSTTYQRWETGRVGFESDGASIAETDNAYIYSLNVVRTGGSSGVAQATLRFDRDDKRCAWIKGLEELGQADTVFAFDDEEWNGSEIELNWASGNADTKTIHIYINPNNNADGTLQLPFVLEKGESDAGLGTSSFVLTIRDNDTANPGTLAIVATSPACQKAGSLVARGGSDVEISVSRSGGSDGFVLGELSATSGNFGGDETAEFWWDSRDSTNRTAVLTLPEYSDEADTVWVTLSAFYGARTAPAGKTLAIKLVAPEALAFDRSEAVIEGAVRYAPIKALEVPVQGGLGTDWGEVSVVKFAGSLPPGVAWSYDADMHSVRFEGVPTASGSFSASYRVYEGAVAGMTLTVAAEVSDPIASVAASLRTYSDVPVMDNTVGSLAGLMTLTLPQSGKASAKYRSVDGRTLVYAAQGWSEFTDDESFVATLSSVADTNATMTVKVDSSGSSSGSVSVEFADPAAAGDDYSVVPASVGEFSPDNWRGYYTVNFKQVEASDDVLATGDGYALLNMTNESSLVSGRVAYAGILPNGKGFSGVATLQPGEYDNGIGEYTTALLPVVSSGGADSLCGVFAIKPYASKEYKTKRRSVYAADSAKFVWTHDEPVESASYQVKFDAYGGFYDHHESLAECCEGTFETLDLMFFALPEMLPLKDEFALGSPYAWATNSALEVGVRYNEARRENKLGLLRPSAAKAAAGLTMNVDLSVGTVNGSFELEFENGVATVLYRGVILPGWGTGCGSCTLGNTESIERPFIGGSFWFSDTLPYMDSKSRRRQLSLKRGAPISVGTAPGE